jgi:hypothetical protein
MFLKWRLFHIVILRVDCLRRTTFPESQRLPEQQTRLVRYSANTDCYLCQRKNAKMNAIRINFSRCAIVITQFVNINFTP